MQKKEIIDGLNMIGHDLHKFAKELHAHEEINAGANPDTMAFYNDHAKEMPKKSPLERQYGDMHRRREFLMKVRSLDGNPFVELIFITREEHERRTNNRDNSAYLGYCKDHRKITAVFTDDEGIESWELRINSVMLHLERVSEELESAENNPNLFTVLTSEFTRKGFK